MLISSPGASFRSVVAYEKVERDCSLDLGFLSAISAKKKAEHRKLPRHAAETLEKQQELRGFVFENKISSGGVDGRTPEERMDTSCP